MQQPRKADGVLAAPKYLLFILMLISLSVPGCTHGYHAHHRACCIAWSSPSLRMCRPMPTKVCPAHESRLLFPKFGTAADVGKVSVASDCCAHISALLSSTCRSTVTWAWQGPGCRGAASGTGMSTDEITAAFGWAQAAGGSTAYQCAIHAYGC